MSFDYKFLNESLNKNYSKNKYISTVIEKALDQVMKE